MNLTITPLRTLTMAVLAALLAAFLALRLVLFVFRFLALLVLAQFLGHLLGALEDFKSEIGRVISPGLASSLPMAPSLVSFSMIATGTLGG